jgi:hypothetical protein
MGWRSVEGDEREVEGGIAAGRTGVEGGSLVFHDRASPEFGRAGNEIEGGSQACVALPVVRSPSLNLVGVGR